MPAIYRARDGCGVSFCVSTHGWALLSLSIDGSSMTFDMDSALLWELAQDSAQEVATVAAGLSMKESRNLSQNRWKIPLIKSLGE